MQFEIKLEELQSKGIFISIPMYGGLCYGTMVSSLLDFMAVCARHNVKVQTHFLYNESLIQRARNYCADAFLRSDCDTMLFIDSDIQFKPIDVFAMWHLQNTTPEYDVLCGPYPKKCISWEKVQRAVEKGFGDDDPNNLENFAGDYVFSSATTGTVSLAEPFEVLESGTGFMMIRREALEKWRDAYPEYQYRPDHVRTKDFDGSRQIHAFFHCEIDPDTNQYLSEDYFFCRMARKAGMKIWLCPWIELKHTGTYTFGGSLSHIAAIGDSTSADVTRIKKR